MLKKLLISGLLAVAMVGTGCKTVSTGPQVAPTFYSQASAAMDGFSSTLVQAQSLFNTAYQEKMLDQADYEHGQQVFQQIAISAQAIVAALQSGQSQTNVLALISTLTKQVSGMPAAFAIKNPESQAAFSAIMNSLVAILQATSSQVTAAAGK